MELSGDELLVKSKRLTTAAQITSFNSFQCLSKLGASTGSLQMEIVWNETVVLRRWETDKKQLERIACTLCLDTIKLQFFKFLVEIFFRALLKTINSVSYLVTTYNFRSVWQTSPGVILKYLILETIQREKRFSNTATKEPHFQGLSLSFLSLILS